MVPAMRTSNVRLVALAVGHLFYIIIGAAIFAAIEGPEERLVKNELLATRDDFLGKHKACLTDDELEQFIEKIVKAANRGVSATRNVTMSEPNWSYGQAIFFACTVLTTIGYGRVTPLSDGGKGFCIVYATLGIPLTLILFTALVERILIPVKAFLYFLFRKLGHLYKAFHIQLLHLAIMAVGLVTFFMLIPAAVFAVLEPSWNYLDGVYYCFISLTTIGLGDYIPGDSADQPNRALYKVATTLYLLTGLVMMMVVLSVLYDIPELNLGFHFYLKSDNIDEEQTRLRNPSNAHGPGLKYTKQVDEVEKQTPAQDNFSSGGGTYQSFQDKDIGED